MSTSDCSVSRSASQTSSAASSVQPPAKTESRANRRCSSRREQLVAPLDRRPQRPLALGSASRAAREQRRGAASSRSRICAGRERLHARGRQLERERQVVEAAADLGDGLVGSKSDRPRALAEELDASRSRRAAAPGTRCSPGSAAARGSSRAARGSGSGSSRSASSGAASTTCSKLSRSRSSSLVADVLGQAALRAERLRRRRRARARGRAAAASGTHQTPSG